MADNRKDIAITSNFNKEAALALGHPATDSGQNRLACIF
jgi:hypothetical protein